MTYTKPNPALIDAADVPRFSDVELFEMQETIYVRQMTISAAERMTPEDWDMRKHYQAIDGAISGELARRNVTPKSPTAAPIVPRPKTYSAEVAAEMAAIQDGPNFWPAGAQKRLAALRGADR